MKAVSIVCDNMDFIKVLKTTPMNIVNILRGVKLVYPSEKCTNIINENGKAASNLKRRFENIDEGNAEKKSKDDCSVYEGSSLENSSQEI